MPRKLRISQFLTGIILILLPAYQVFGQSVILKDKFRYISITAHSGSHIYTGDKLKEALDNGYGAVSIKYGWQSGADTSSWQKYYGFPSYGIGVYAAGIGNPDILGNPNAVYGFISFPVFQTRKTVFAIETDLGLTYDLKPYDSEINPLNDAISSKVSVYFSLNFNGTVWLNREVDLTYGFDLTHFSNGRTFTPNFGLNMAGLNIGMLYHFNRSQKSVDRSIKPSTLLDVRPDLPATSKDYRADRFKITLIQAIGTTQKHGTTDGKRYFNSSTSFEVAYKRTLKHTWLLGFDVLYDGSLAGDYPETSERVIYAIHPGYDFSFWKFDLRAQVGFYLGDNKGKGSFFMRPGLKYNFNDYLFAHLALKTTSEFAADWVEYGIGVTLWSK